ncbi:bifunctional hydroxymethylpyrimidine kinase/phosphomethylpyrimidine kinase [Paenibacillus sp. JNUCC32]|uniref:bifunctional hydroxymethylpyrimidine kinase/phosphomethylpyrimidine kinase n=1 Tax=Paenibacillus sp. JNUCC32 TaxID=2777984 RepID=UPI001788253C|nr:bifunctional hydroxymethylpyrimidine kinase/phosphomethylpyrimidine kinase [Paenibacillus sp. JNUCC-32]QOT08386.1 bifunctional hydroxymethylpyrimidine kinase/phosphomethylpyrimidine kinase [Paenibacillus sp. JNUCC-32]
MSEARIPRALTIAGSDSGGGAGIQADLKTFQELGVYGMSAITAITVQNTLGVHGVYPLPPEATAEQIEAVGSDLGIDALKTGMLFNAEIIRLVADRIRAFGWGKVVVDPVMIAKGGAELLQSEAVEALREDLLPLALIVTPNIPEAEVLAGMRIRTMNDRKEAARRIHALGPRIVVIKGGHDEGILGSDEGTDHERDRGPAITAGMQQEELPQSERTHGLTRTAMPAGEYRGGRPLFSNDDGYPESLPVIDIVYDGTAFTDLYGKRIDTVHTHGTGCTFSAAITAGLAQGLSALDAIQSGRLFIQAAIEDGLNLGQGQGPTNHWAYNRRRQEVLR